MIMNKQIIGIICQRSKSFKNFNPGGICILNNNRKYKHKTILCQLLLFREKLELWLPNGIALPNSIDISKLGKKSALKSQDINKAKNVTPSRKNDTRKNIADETTTSETQQTQIKTEDDNNIGTGINSMADGSFSNDLYEPSFKSQNSVRYFRCSKESNGFYDWYNVF